MNRSEGAVATAMGPIAPASLGRVLMHEHVFVLDHEHIANDPGSWDDEERTDDAVRKLQRLKAAGIDTIVDLTVLGLGRDIRRIRRVAERTEVQIVVATGYYTFDRLPNYIRLRGPGQMLGGEEPLVEMFVRDIEEGIGDTGVKAGILKCATDAQGVTPDVERVLRAVAAAHNRTGVPISTHTDAWTERGLEQQRIFTEEGVDLGRVVIGHSGDTDDLGYLEKLIAGGSYLGMDRFGLDSRLDFDRRVATVVELVRRGFADRMVLSHDASCQSQNFPEDYKQRVLPNWHYTHIPEDVVPALQAAGVTEDAIEAMLVHNPRRILST